MRRSVLPLLLALAAPSPPRRSRRRPPIPPRPDAAHGSTPAVPVKRAAAVRIVGRAPAVDGRLDDAAWAAAPVLSGLTQKDPREGEPATERTEVRFLYDNHALYVGARMVSSEPAKIQAPVSRRDVFQQAETFGVSLDTYHDRRTAYTFAVTAAGRAWTSTIRATSATTPVAPVWVARTRATRRVDGGDENPLSQLRFNPGGRRTGGGRAALDPAKEGTTTVRRPPL